MNTVLKPSIRLNKRNKLYITNCEAVALTTIPLRWYIQVRLALLVKGGAVLDKKDACVEHFLCALEGGYINRKPSLLAYAIEIKLVKGVVDHADHKSLVQYY